MQAGVKERYDTFIANMLLNGFNGALAVRQTPGYSDKYAHTTARRLSTITYIKEGLACKQTELAEKRGFKLEDAQRMYEEDRDFARKCRQSGAAVSATTGICRLYGMDKDANIGEKTVIIISPKVSKVIESTPIEPQQADTGEKE